MHVLRFLTIGATLLAVAHTGLAQVRMSTDQALKLAFPKCEIERRTVKLDTKQRLAIGKLCGRKFDKSVVFAYIARKGKTLVGTAWFDVHKVRSKQQLVMVAVTPSLVVDRIEVLAFAEPKRYAAPRKWLDKIHGTRREKVRPPRIAGATLTVRATTRCVERILAAHEVVFGKPPAKQDVKQKSTKEKATKQGNDKPATEKAKQAKRTGKNEA